MSNRFVALWFAAFCAVTVPAWAEPACDGQANIALKATGTTEATFLQGKTVELTGLAGDLPLAAPVRDPDPQKACTLNGDDAFAKFKARYPKLSPDQNQAATLALPAEAGCVRFENKQTQQSLVLRFQQACPGEAPKEPAPAELTTLKVVTLDANGKASGTIAVGTATAVTIDNTAGTADVTLICAQGDVSVLAKALKGKKADLQIPAKLALDGGVLTCDGGFKLDVTAQPKAPAAPKISECTIEQLDPINDDRLAAYSCGGVKDGAVQLCLSASGQLLGTVPELYEGQIIVVKVIVHSGFNARLDLDVTFNRTLVAHADAIAEASKLKSGDTLRVAVSRQVSLTGLGKLEITFKRAKGAQTLYQVGKTGAVTESSCDFPELSVPISFPVSGHYHFSAGIMVAYTHLQSRSFSRQTGDDGITRIGEQSSPGIDYVLNVTAYPFGVDEEHDVAALGLLFGTSVASLGKRWFAGVELSSPIGFGVSAGGALSVVSKLDEPLVARQPFSGDQLATHDVAEPTWYVGVNLQATLFKTIFGALLGEKKEGGTK